MDTDKIKFKEEKFTNHHNIITIKPDFDSKLSDLIIELEKLREKRISSKIHPMIFFQLKKIFHILESVENNRFEGNPTTIAEFIETKIEHNKENEKDEHYIAINNTEKALDYIEKNLKKGEKINTQFIRTIHSIVVDGLTPLPDGEWSENPGGYKKKPNKVWKHIAPEPTYIESYMQELEEFINKDIGKKYELIYTAIAHHRFVWIHPFDNGNWRVVRLLTYAMLIKQWLINNDIKMFQIINPTGIFWNKKKYSDLLAECDTWKVEKIEEWCEYVLEWILKEINKIDKILNIDYTKNQILLPAIKYAYERHYIDKFEEEILNTAANNTIVKLDDLTKTFPEGTQKTKITYNIRKLKTRGILLPIAKNSRIYTIWFMKNELLRCIVQRLREEWFIDFE